MKQQMLLSLLLIIYLLISCASEPDGNVQEPAIKIGFMICNSEDETLYRFQPLTEYLSKKLGVRMEAKAIDTIRFTGEVENLDFTHTNSLLYIIMNRFYGVSPLTADIQGSLGFRSKGAIVTTKESDIHSLADMKGKSMVFGPMLAPTGYLQQYDLMLQGGIDPEDDLTFYTIPTGTYKHEKVIYSVLYGKYDAGAFQMLDFERMLEDGKIDPDDFRVIAEGEPIPYCTFGVTQRVDDAIAVKFREALLELNEEETVEIDGEVVNVLKRARLEGFQEVKDRDFDVLREIAKRTNMPPYQKY